MRVDRADGVNFEPSIEEGQQVVGELVGPGGMDEVAGDESDLAPVTEQTDEFGYVFGRHVAARSAAHDQSRCRDRNDHLGPRKGGPR